MARAEERVGKALKRDWYVHAAENDEYRETCAAHQANARERIRSSSLREFAQIELLA